MPGVGSGAEGPRGGDQPHVRAGRDRGLRIPRAITNPLVIIEVLSPSTEDYDRGSKLHHYRRIPSLDEYVLVAQEERSIVIMRRSGDLWSFEDVGPEGALRLASLDVELPIDAIYRDPLGVIVPVE